MNVDRLLDDLKHYEGEGPRRNGMYMPYVDTKGKITIGFGYNLSDNGLPPEIVERLLTWKAMEAHKALMLRFPGFNQLDEVRQRALVDMTYNMGPRWFERWPIFVGQIQRKEWEAAYRNMRTTNWYKDVGHRRGDPISYMIRTGTDPEHA